MTNNNNLLKRVNAYNSLSVLFYHKDLIDEIVKLNDVNGMTRSDFEKAVRTYIEKYKIVSGGSDNAKKKEVLRLIQVANFENLKDNGLIDYNSMSRKVVFSRDVSSLIVKIKNEKVDFFDTTLTKHELAFELRKLKDYIEHLDNYYLIDNEIEKEDVIKNILRGVEDLYMKIEKNNYDLEQAIQYFVNTKNNVKTTLADRKNRADELKKHRVEPFQNFLLYSVDPDDKDKKLLVSDLIEKIGYKLDNIGLHDRAILLYSYNIAIKEINKTILEQSKKLNSITRSARERIQMMEYSNYLIDRLEKEMKVQDGYNQHNRNIYNLPMIEEINFFDNLSVSLYSDLTNPNHIFFSDNIEENIEFLTKVKIEKPKLTEESKRRYEEKIKIKEEEVKKLKKIEVYKKEIQKKIKKWGSLTLSEVENILSLENVDLYEMIDKDIRETCKIPADFLNHNMLYSVVKNCIFKLKYNRNVYYEIVDRVEDLNGNIKPIFKFTKRINK